MSPRETVVRPAAVPEESIFIKTGTRFHKLNAAEVLYIESIKDYIVVHRQGKEKLSAKYKIGDLEEDLKDKGFLRIHRSFIVNLNKITAFSAQDVEIGAVQLPVGNSYKEYVFKVLKVS
nr:LytTR family transcriptional regulator DNA-binding domain-containing protein [Chitinophaga nivalis]